MLDATEVVIFGILMLLSGALQEHFRRKWLMEVRINKELKRQVELLELNAVEREAVATKVNPEEVCSTCAKLNNPICSNPWHLKPENIR